MVMSADRAKHASITLGTGKIRISGAVLPTTTQGIAGSCSVMTAYPSVPMGVAIAGMKIRRKLAQVKSRTENLKLNDQ